MTGVHQLRSDDWTFRPGPGRGRLPFVERPVRRTEGRVTWRGGKGAVCSGRWPNGFTVALGFWVGVRTSRPSSTDQSLRSVPRTLTSPAGVLVVLTHVRGESRTYRVVGSLVNSREDTATLPIRRPWSLPDRPPVDGNLDLHSLRVPPFSRSL